MTTLLAEPARTDTVIGRTVAVKILTEQGCADPEAKARFLQEARMAGNIQHENIIQIRDFGVTEQNLLFYTMDFFPGRSLKKLIETEGALQPIPLGPSLLVALDERRRERFLQTWRRLVSDGTAP